MKKTFRDYMASVTGPAKQNLMIDIAKACNVNIGSVQNWMYTDQRPKAANKEIIAKMLDMPVNDLFPEKNN